MPAAAWEAESATMMNARAEEALDPAVSADAQRPPRLQIVPTAGHWSGVRLSPRERETLELLLTGAPQKQIAARMGVSLHTAHDYVKTLYKKLGVNSRLELMAMAIGRR
jgi:DNA-binding CsgD family transcriptional regulator